MGGGEADLPALLHRVNTSNMLSEVSAGSLGTVTFILKISNILKYFNTLSSSDVEYSPNVTNSMFIEENIIVK